MVSGFLVKLPAMRYPPLVHNYQRLITGSDKHKHVFDHASGENIDVQVCGRNKEKSDNVTHHLNGGAPDTSTEAHITQYIFILFYFQILNHLSGVHCLVIFVT